MITSTRKNPTSSDILGHITSTGYSGAAMYYAVTVTVDQNSIVTPHLSASTDVFYIKTSNSAFDSSLTVGINYTSASLASIVLDPSTIATNSSTNPIELWAMPHEDDTTQHWASAGIPLNILFKDDSSPAALIATKYKFSNLDSKANYFRYLDDTIDNSGIDYEDSASWSSASVNTISGYLYPTEQASSSNYDSRYPYPASGNAYFTITAKGEGVSDQTRNIYVKVHKSTSKLTLAESSGTHYANIPIVLTVTKDGEESWSDMSLAVGSISTTSGPSIHSSVTSSVSGNQITLTFPTTLSGTWVGVVTVIADNHYGFEVEKSITLTVEPAIQGVSIKYNNTECASTGHDGSLTIWYNDPSTHTTTFALDASAGQGNIDWSYTPTNGVITAGSGTGIAAGLRSFTVNTTDRNGNQSYTIKAASSIRSEIYAQVSVLLQKVTDTVEITTATTTVNNTMTLAAGGIGQFKVFINGDEDLSSYVSSTTPQIVAFADTSDAAISYNNVVGTLFSFTDASLGIDTTTGRQYILYTITGANSIANDTTIRVRTSFSNHDGTTKTSSSYLTLNITKSVATSVALYNSSDNSISALGDFWYTPSTTYGFYGVVNPSSIGDSLRHLSYGISPSGGVLAFNSIGTDVPSGKSQGLMTLGFSNNNPFSKR